MDSNDGAIIPVLFLVTLLIALALGVWQYRRSRKARREHQHTTLGDNPAPRESGGAEQQRRGERIG